MILYVFLILVGLIAILFIGALVFVKYKDWRSKSSWDVSWISSREAGESSSVKYTEKNHYFFLYGSPDKHGIIMPDKDLWETNMPDFWKDKWAVIKQRLEDYLKRNTNLILTNNIEEIPNIDCFDDNLPKGHKDRVVRIKFTRTSPNEN